MLFLLLSLLMPILAWADCPEALQIPGEYLAEELSTSPGLQKTSPHFEIQYLQPPQQKYLNKIGTGKSRPVLIKTNRLDLLRQQPGLIKLEANCKYSLASLPNDPMFSQQWSHKSFDSLKAWKLQKDAKDIRIAVIDTGIETSHPDLRSSLWVNEAEAMGQEGIDDDNNGYIDDLHGYDFSNQDADPSPGHWSGAQHGTHVAGIAGAEGNNGIGITGMAWNSQIMALKVFPDDSDDASLAAVVEAIYYAVDMGADIINLSLGARKLPSSSELRALEYAFSHDVMVIAAAGNNGEETLLYSPASIKGVYAVGSINSQDQLSSFSNYGRKIFLVAPGGDSPNLGGLDEKILSTVPMDLGGYGSLRGTSMAAPLVAGAAALIMQRKPDLSTAEVAELLQSRADTLNLKNNNRNQSPMGYKKLNLFKSLVKISSDKENTKECDNWCQQQKGAQTASRHIDYGGSSGGCHMPQIEMAQTEASANPIILILIPLALVALRKRN